MYFLDGKEFKNSETLDIYLIAKYFNKQNEKPKLDLKNQKHLNFIVKNKSPLAKGLGEKDIGFFALYYLTDFFVATDENSNRDLDQVHYEIFEELNRMFVKDEYDKEEFILPRGLGKSTVINKLLGAWAHAYRKSRYTVVIGKREDDAVGFIDSTKQFLKSKKIVEDFRVLVDESDRERVTNKQELELTNNSKLIAFSSGSSIRGTTYSCDDGVFRPSIIIVDDFINENDILSDEAKEKIVNKYYKEILESGDEAVYRNGKKIKAATKFLVIGTPLAADDFINTIKNDAEFHNFHRSVMTLNPDEYFIENKYWQRFKKILLNNRDENRLKNAENYYYENIDKMQFKTVWNDKYKPWKLAIKYFTKRLSFMQELMCDCEKVGDIWIKYLAVMNKLEIEDRKFDRTILSIDQSASNKAKSDFTSFTVLSRCNGFYFVRKGHLEKFESETEFDKYIARVIEFLKEFKEITHIVLEKNVYKGIDATRIEEAIKKDKELKFRGIKVITIYNTKNKDSRIMTITDKINSGTVIFNEEDTKYNQQVKDFRGQKFSLHDDAIDSLEMAINNIDTIKITRKATMKFIKREALRR